MKIRRCDSRSAPDPHLRRYASPAGQLVLSPDVDPRSPRRLAADLRGLLPGRTTAREVVAFEHLVGGRPLEVCLGDLEQHAGRMWAVAGIYEPAGPRDPWWVALVARQATLVILRTPVTEVDSDAVVRVRDLAA